LRLLPWQANPTGKIRSNTANPVVSRPGRLLTSPEGAIGELGGDASTLAMVCLHCLPRLASFSKTGTGARRQGARTTRSSAFLPEDFRTVWGS